MAFEFRSPNSGPVEYSIQYDRFVSPLAEGQLMHVAGRPSTVSFVLDKPGVIHCEMRQNGEKWYATAAVSPYDIRPLEEEPSDFDAFWSAQKAGLRELPMNTQLEFLQRNEYSSTYRIQLDHIDNRKVYGYLVIPDGDGPFPACITMPSFGGAPNIVEPEVALAERANMLAISVSIHNAPPDQADPNAYRPDVINQPEGIYYRYAILAGLRALDYLAGRSDFNGRDMAAFGVSQGAALALQVAGLHERVNLLGFSNPSSCQHLGLKYDQPSGFPFYLWQSRGISGSAEHFAATVAATKYYDAVYFARRYQGPCMVFTSLKDITAPAATQLAAINLLRGQKVALLSRDLTHEQNPDEYWQGRFAFIRQHIPDAFQAPWPWGEETRDFAVSAGRDQGILWGESVQLEGQASFNGRGLDVATAYEWRLEEGPGIVNFSQRETKNTSASFEKPGTYTLSFSAMPDTLNEQGKFYRLTDHIEVRVADRSSSSTKTEESSIQLYPNPADNWLRLGSSWPDQSATYTIYDIQGQLLRRGRLEGSPWKLETADLPAGLFHLQLHLENDHVFSTRFVVLH